MSSVQDWYNFILDKMPIESNRAMRIKNLTNLASILGQDLREGCNASHDQFQSSLSVNYKQLCFRQANSDVGGDGFVHFLMQWRSEMNIRGL